MFLCYEVQIDLLPAVDKNYEMKRINGCLLIISICACQQTVAQKPGASKITAFIDARIYTSPNSAVIDNSVLIIKDEKIVSVGKKGETKIPAGAKIVDCKGLVIVAGFWNCHVHLMDPRITSSDDLSDNQLTGYLQDFLTRYGVTHVYDIGSFTANTLSIRKRIESGKVKGPSILTTGFPFVPKGGNPFYMNH